MMYKATVLTNNTFLTDGYIWVRIDNRTDDGLGSDISSNPQLLKMNLTPELDDGKDVDYPGAGGVICYVTSAFGAGHNYGMFHLPQVNSRGIVAYLDGSTRQCVWLGGLYEKVDGIIDLPHSNGIENPNSTDNANKIENMNGAVVIVTKTTKLEDPLNPKYEELDMRQRQPENVFVLDRESISLQHNALNDNEESQGISRMRLDKDGIFLDFYNNEGGKVTEGTIATMKKDDGTSEFNFTISDNQTRNEIIGGLGELKLITTKGSTSKALILSTDSDTGGVLLQSGNNEVSITDKAINIKSAKNVIISAAGKVKLGGDLNVVVTRETNKISAIEQLGVSKFAQA